MKFLCQAVQKLQSEQMDRQIDRQTDKTDTQTDMTENITYLHMQVVNIKEWKGNRQLERHWALWKIGKCLLFTMSTTSILPGSNIANRTHHLWSISQFITFLHCRLPIILVPIAHSAYLPKCPSPSFYLHILIGSHGTSFVKIQDYSTPVPYPKYILWKECFQLSKGFQIFWI